MKHRRSPRSSKPSTAAEPGFEANVLRLVADASDRRAIRSGEIDAVIDPHSGQVILLPKAQAELLAGKARFRSLVELATDGYWEQDEHFRFAMHTGAAIGNFLGEGASILGKTLWELPFDNGDQIDWQMHRTQLEWRAIFRDLELQCVDSEGNRRIISISGEPLFESEEFKGYRGITREIAGREPSQIALGSDSFAGTILDSLVTQVCVLDAAGVILKSNTAWRVLAATYRDAAVGEGSNYLELCARIDGSQQVDAAAMIAGIRQVLAGERELFRYEYYCDVQTPRWFMATVVRIRGDNAARAIVSYEDITGIKEAERLLRVECAVARSLSETGSASAAVQAVIQALCEAQRWDCGQFFQFDPVSETLFLEHSWGNPKAEVVQFIEKSRGATFRLGAGLAGRVCQSGEPAWLHAKSGNTSIQTLAHEVSGGRTSADNLGAKSGMDAAFAFPVVAAGKSIGVLAFVSRSVSEPNDRLLRSVRSIGDQLGRFLFREHAATALGHSELRFRRLTELSSDWIWEQDRDFRFTKFTGSGMAGIGNVLGKTLWELPSIVLSEEAWTKHKSELQARWSFCDFEYATVLPDGRRHRYRISGEPLYDAADAFVGFHGTGLDITHQQFEASAAVAEI